MKITGGKEVKPHTKAAVTLIGVFVAGILIVGTIRLLSGFPTQCDIIEGFVLNDDEVVLDVVCGNYHITNYVTRDQLEQIDIGAIVNMTPFSEAQADSEGQATISISKRWYNTPNIILLAECTSDGCDHPALYIEILTQDRDMISVIFEKEFASGYAILARTNFSFSDSGIVKSGAPPPVSVLPVSDGPLNLDRVDLESEMGVTAGMSSNHAVAIVRELWREPIFTGPTAFQESAIGSAGELLKRLRKGETSTQCTSFRDLFLSYALKSSGVDSVRPIEISQGEDVTGFGDLLYNSHAATEIYDSELEKWIYFDPWLGLVITEHSVPLSAVEIQERLLENDLEELVVHHIANRKRKLVDSDIPPQLQRRVLFTETLMNQGFFSYFRAVFPRGVAYRGD